MITLKEHNEYSRYYNLCWRCKSAINGLDFSVDIIQNISLNEGRTLRFHKKCFEEIAGDAYVIEKALGKTNVNL